MILPKIFITTCGHGAATTPYKKIVYVKIASEKETLIHKETIRSICSTNETNHCSVHEKKKKVSKEKSGETETRNGRNA